MKFELDENLGSLGRDLLEGAGHGVATVSEQNLEGTEDEHLFDVCRREGKALITLDHDFGQVLRFPPETAAGVVILECPDRLSPDLILTRVRESLAVLQARPLDRELWIVEPGRVRIREPSK